LKHLLLNLLIANIYIRSLSLAFLAAYSVSGNVQPQLVKSDRVCGGDWAAKGVPGSLGQQWHSPTFPPLRHPPPSGPPSCHPPGTVKVGYGLDKWCPGLSSEVK